MPKKVFAPGNRWLVAYLAFLSAFAPLSTDMYLPALPHMTQALQTTDALSSLSISCFLLLFGASMLFWGPLSDKYGRKPVLYTGALLYVVSSLFLALAQSIWPLLFWRAVQAIGSGGISAMALAIVKDVLRGRAMEKVITWIQTITILAPMLAPVIGGALLAVTDWRGIFACLLLCGLLAGAGTLLLRETMHHPGTGQCLPHAGPSAGGAAPPGIPLPAAAFFRHQHALHGLSGPFLLYLPGPVRALAPGLQPVLRLQCGHEHAGPAGA